MLQNMKGQFAEHLLAAGFVNSKDPKDPTSNINSGIYLSPLCKYKTLGFINVPLFVRDIFSAVS